MLSMSHNANLYPWVRKRKVLSPGSWSVPGTVEKEKKRNFSACRKATKIKCRTGFNNYKSVNQQIKRSKNNNYWKDRFCVCVTGPTCNSATQRKRERAFHHKFLWWMLSLWTWWLHFMGLRGQSQSILVGEFLLCAESELLILVDRAL